MDQTVHNNSPYIFNNVDSMTNLIILICKDKVNILKNKKKHFITKVFGLTIIQFTSWTFGLFIETLASDNATGADGCVTAGLTLISSDFCCQ